MLIWNSRATGRSFRVWWQRPDTNHKEEYWSYGAAIVVTALIGGAKFAMFVNQIGSLPWLKYATITELCTYFCFDIVQHTYSRHQDIQLALLCRQRHLVIARMAWSRRRRDYNTGYDKQRDMSVPNRVFHFSNFSTFPSFPRWFPCVFPFWMTWKNVRVLRVIEMLWAGSPKSVWEHER